MKKICFILGLLLVLTVNAQATLYHGIDIDDIYTHSEWNSKEDIKQLIDDYTLMLQYQDELNKCPDFVPDSLDCYDKVAEKIVTNLFVDPKYNLKRYKQFKKALAEAYGLKNCRNKYAWPSGHMCEIDTLINMDYTVKKYIQDLINFSKEKMIEYSPIFDDYK